MKRTRLRVTGIFVLLLILLVGGCRNAGHWFSKEAVPQHADALVLLMGNFTDRVLKTADLYAEGKAGRVIIAEESMGGYQGLIDRGVFIISHTTQAVNSLVALGVPADSIAVLPGDAESTLDEALLVREYLRENPGIDTIILVSSPYHLRRATAIFRKAFKKANMPVVTGAIGSSPYSAFNADRWWRSKEDIQDVVFEMIKMANFRFIESRRLKVKE